MIDKLYKQMLSIRFMANHRMLYQIYMDEYVVATHIAGKGQHSLLQTCLIDDFDFNLLNKTFEAAKLVSTKRKLDIEFFKMIGGKHV
jgi:hypothetical protein